MMVSMHTNVEILFSKRKCAGIMVGGHVKYNQRNGIKVEVARYYNGIVESTADACLLGHSHIKIYV